MKLNAIALLFNNLAVKAGPVVHLVPAGEFEGRDGRPGKGLTWKLPDTNGRALAARMTARHEKVQFLMDYEHQSMLSEANGQPAPAAAWASKFEWRDGQGLYATDVEWTARAKQMIEDKEYKYLSPVIAYNPETGLVTGVRNASLVNDPALEELSPIAQERLARLNADFFTKEDDDMNAILKALLEGLGLPATDATTEAQATAALASLKTARSDLTAMLKSLGVAETTDAATASTAIAALKTKAEKAAAGAEPDPAKFVSLEKFNQLATEIAALKSSGVHREVDELIAKATADGKCAGVVADVWRNVGKTDIAQLKALIEKTPANLALAGQRQSDATVIAANSDKLSDDEIAVCKATGVKPEEFLTTRKSLATAVA